MLKMSDVLGHDLVQNFPHALTSSRAFDSNIDMDDLINQAILQAPTSSLYQAICSFFDEHDVVELAQALDITPESLEAIQAGEVSKAQLDDTGKIVALCLALETQTLAQVEIPECLKDYPI